MMGKKKVDAVSGINGVFKHRIGVSTAKKLSCKYRGMTKRKYYRWMMKKTGSNVKYAMDSYVCLRAHCKRQRDCSCRS
ncbi:hypothetical protein GH868_29520 [Bacillus thuringiensis]|nr:hypothetical protein [Bacillus thuringiensis]